jgi:hypothetical protein
MSDDRQAEAARALRDHIRSFLRGEIPTLYADIIEDGLRSQDAYLAAIEASLFPGEPEPERRADIDIG